MEIIPVVLAFRGILVRLWACGGKGSSWAKAGALHTGGGSGGEGCFDPTGPLARSEDIFGCHWGDDTGIQWVQAGVIAPHPIIHPAPKNSPGQNAGLVLRSRMPGLQDEGQSPRHRSTPGRPGPFRDPWTVRSDSSRDTCPRLCATYSSSPPANLFFITCCFHLFVSKLSFYSQR